MLLLVLSGCSQVDPEEHDAEDSEENNVSEAYVTEYLDYAKTTAKDVHLKPLKGDFGEHLFPELIVKDDELKSDLQKALVKLLQESTDPYVVGAQTGGEAVEAELNTMVSHWKSIRTQLTDRKQKLFEARATTQVQGQAATLLSMDNSRFWVFFALAIGGLGAVVLHERRHALRCVLNGGTARALGMTSVLSVVLVLLLALLVSYAFFGNSLYEFVLEIGAGEESPRGIAQKKLDELTKEHSKVAEKVGDVDRSFDDSVEVVSKQLGKELRFATPVVSQWKQNRKHMTASLVNLNVEEAIAKSLSIDLAELEQVEQHLEDEKDKAIGYARMKRKIRFALGFFLLFVTGGGIYLFDHGARKRQKAYSDTCPLCLTDSFKNVPLRGASESDRRCKKKLEDKQNCAFDYKDIYRLLPKLCFATLGHPTSGKTMWLMFCYRQLKHRQNLPKNVHYEAFTDDALKEVEDSLREFLENEGEPVATDPGKMPRPLLFNFRDQDPWGPSQELLSIFDFSGEIIQEELNTGHTLSIQRERALKADGFFYFLDPTIPRSDEQMDSLIRFRDDIREMMGLRPGDQVKIPVALCLSKVDLLGNMPYADPGGSGFVGQFYEDLTAIDNDPKYKGRGSEITIEKIERRSQLVQDLIPQIWEDWNIEDEIRSLFGGRIMFFPMTPIGLGTPFENDPTSIEGRAAKPYHILEPMLWMVHMTGHLVLDDMSRLSRFVKKVNPLIKKQKH